MEEGKAVVAVEGAQPSASKSWKAYFLIGSVVVVAAAVTAVTVFLISDSSSTCTGNGNQDCIKMKPSGQASTSRRLAGELLPANLSSSTFFTCEGGSCDLSTNCNADVFYLRQAFLIGDEKGPSGRNHAGFEACGIEPLLRDETELDVGFDFACGCTSLSDYFSQEVNDTSTDHCGLLRIGIDQYTSDPAVSSDVNDSIERNGEELYYIRQDDVEFFSDFKELKADVASEAISAGAYTLGYTFPIPRDSDYGCRITYVLEFNVVENTTAI
eukprot:CAMPEP_0184006012 /NCGR_PEP_ID=MMETSP0954-20121128/412_1 /TAXON_ID=627963 /ORGANISM="Aplanochytrium sp, Strain PBS07" /LENGTH=269 /DNA_ID=CAMNT_0026284425 /DNA_START=95 /DNA_END=904 /DNA_ORIENTATION=+